MKIEDIKTGDVIVRTEDGMINKVAEVTPDGLILRSAYTDMAKCFHVFLKPDGSKLTAKHYEPATEEQRQYMDSQLAAFNGTNTEAASKRITALASIMGDLKQENNELVERVKHLMDDYNRLARRIRSYHTVSDLTEALDKLEELERDRDFCKKQYDHGQRLYESLFNQHDIQSKELKVVREERDEAKEQYNELQHKYEELSQQLNTANSKNKNAEKRLDEADEEYHKLVSLLEEANKRIARIGHSFLMREGNQCRRDVKVNVDSEVCLNCKHCMRSFLSATDYILCAYDYDKQEESNNK